MSSTHLTLRLSREDTLLIERLRDHLGLTKSDLVKRALHHLAEREATHASPAVSLFTLGEGRFGRYGDKARQSSRIKAIVRERVKAKRAA